MTLVLIPNFTLQCAKLIFSELRINVSKLFVLINGTWKMTLSQVLQLPCNYVCTHMVSKHSLRLGSSDILFLPNVITHPIGSITTDVVLHHVDMTFVVIGCGCVQRCEQVDYKEVCVYIYTHTHTHILSEGVWERDWRKCMYWVRNNYSRGSGALGLGHRCRVVNGFGSSLNQTVKPV